MSDCVIVKNLSLRDLQYRETKDNKPCVRIVEEIIIFWKNMPSGKCTEFCQAQHSRNQSQLMSAQD